MVWLLSMLCAAWAADPAATAALRLAVQRQEAVVDALAGEVERRRAAGVGRAELGAAMSRYREAAVRLVELEAPLVVGAQDAERAAHAEALRRLAEALASDRVDETARARLVGWVGEPTVRVGVVESVLGTCRGTSDTTVRRALALDIVEQATALALVARYDGARARAEGERASAQAEALRARTGAGQSGALDLVVAAERSERDAATDAERALAADAVVARYDVVRVAAISLSEGAP
jgi:hypothetical protein